MLPENLNPTCKRVFLDTDPGYNQIVMATRPAWSENVDRWIETVKNKHDVHLTYAENIWADDCKVPRVDVDWRPTRCVVTLPHWETVRASPIPIDAPLTTIMTWGYFRGALVHNGVEYEAKANQFEKFKTLPSRTKIPLRLAVSGTKYDPAAIAREGWQFVDALPVSLTAESYQGFIRDSLGEWSVAKHVYVGTNSGWFSCRTACYLAAGRPAVVQETGWSKYVPSGSGVHAFSTLDESIAGCAKLLENPERERVAAYDIAREYLAPDRVLPPMIEAIFASNRTTSPRPFSVARATRP